MTFLGEYQTLDSLADNCVWQVFEHVDMVTTDILGTFLMAAAAQQCKRRAAVTKMVRQNGEGPLNLEAQTSQGPLLSARYSVYAAHTTHSFGFSMPLFVPWSVEKGPVGVECVCVFCGCWVIMAVMRHQQNDVHTIGSLYAVYAPA